MTVKVFPLVPKTPKPDLKWAEQNLRNFKKFSDQVKATRESEAEYRAKLKVTA